MRVALAWYAVSSPTRMRDADLAPGRILIDGILQHLDLTDRAQARETVGAIEDCDAGGIIAAVFQPAQTLHEDGDDIALGDRSDDSTHIP